MSTAHTGTLRSEESIKKTSGTANGMSKANYEIADQIRSLKIQGLTLNQISKQLTVKLSIATISKIANGKIWKK